MVSAAPPGSPSRSGDDETPTQQISPDEQIVPARPVAPDDALKASLLGGNGGKIGRFHVLRLLGEGGMGMVFAGYDEELGRKVAIKLLRKVASEDSVGRARLLREAQTLARLSHPNVVTVYEVGEFGRQIYIAMEFVLGETLQSYLQSRRRSWRELIAVFVEAGRGLAVAHAAGILHRDFKPANVLLGDDGRVRVVDFGLALAQEPAGPAPDALASHVRLPGPVLGTHSHSRITEGLTVAGSIMGTPAYMAPERFTFDRTIDPRSDQFGFCVALFEGLYGARPFPGRSFEDVRDAIVRGTVVDPPGPHDVPAWLRKVVLRGLARDPADRYPDMQALLTALQRDPARTRNRALAGLAAAAVLITGGYALAHATTPEQALVCPDARVKLGPIWDDRRADVERALLATKIVYAADTWTRVAARLDQYADTWAAAHQDACQAHARGEQSPLLLDLRMACLERRRGELTALVDRLAGADSDTVRSAASAVDNLIAPEQCGDTAMLTAAVPLPEEPATARRVVELQGRLAQARAAMAIAKLADAGTIATEVLAAAESLNFRPLLAEALAVRGGIEIASGVYEPGCKHLEEALWLADTVHDDVLLAETMANLVYVLGVRLVRFDDALRWRRHADAVVARIGEASSSHTALLRSFGVVIATQGQPLAARELLQRALAIDEGLPGANEGKVIKDLVALGTAEFHAAKPADARSYHERALTLGERLYGPNHPEIARIATNLATAQAGMGDVDAAAPMFERALAILDGAYGPDHPNSAGTLTNLGAVHAMRKQFDLALPIFERALAIQERTLGPDHPDLAVGLHNMGIIASNGDDLAKAREFHQRALALRERHLAKSSPFIAESLGQLGDLSRREGDLPAALRDLERALALFVANPTHIHKGSLPETRFCLARVLRDLGKRERGILEARQAASEYRALALTEGDSEYTAAIAEIDAWLAEPGATSSTKAKR